MVNECLNDKNSPLQIDRANPIQSIRLYEIKVDLFITNKIKMYFMFCPNQMLLNCSV